MLGNSTVSIERSQPSGVTMMMLYRILDDSRRQLVEIVFPGGIAA
jgi:hypothetical protein